MVLYRVYNYFDWQVKKLAATLFSTNQQPILINCCHIKMLALTPASCAHTSKVYNAGGHAVYGCDLPKSLCSA